VIRPYDPDDVASLSRVCLLTGDSGGDATGKYADDDLLADIFLLPYLALEPSLAHVLELDGRTVGYIVGASDSVAFAEAYRSEWVPRFAARHPLVDPPSTDTEVLAQLGHTTEHLIGPDHALFPAHLHIDLLPEAQGQGWGKQLMRTLLLQLAGEGVPGVQLGVGERNVGAQAFYRRLGFTPLPSTPDDGLRLGIRTDAPLAQCVEAGP
jgi:ribosomal protein S18 acetylase RimI-like enzyme